MLVLKLLMCAGLLLHFPQNSRQSCTKGTAKQCQDAEVIPGSNLAGEGFDISKMERKGTYVLDLSPWKHKDGTCSLCKNPYMENKWQKLPLSVLDWRAQQTCSTKISSKLHKSSESLVSSSTSSVENNWKINLDVDTGTNSASLMMAGTHSKLSEYSMEKTKNDKFSFTSHSMSCQYYSYRVASTPRLHRDFQNAVKSLPKEYTANNKARFYKVIDTFGTHYITKVKLGGSVKSVTSIKQCQASLQGLSVEEVEYCLEVEASASINANINAGAKHCEKDGNKMESKSSFADVFNDRFTETIGGHTTTVDLLFSADKDPSAYKEWLDTVPGNPDIVSYSLSSLHELLPVENPARKNLRSAISHYILEKSLWRNCSSGCQAGVRSNARDSCTCQCHNEASVNLDCCPTRQGVARVVITAQRATGLWGDHTSATDGYVKVFFGAQMIHRTPVIANNNNPQWFNVIDMGSQNLQSTAKVKFEVWDQDNNWDDDLLGACVADLSAGVKQDLCTFSHGRFYYKLEVKCAPSLGGPLCMDYKSSPMSPSLMDLYVSRHAHPVPKAMLREMGVFVNGSNPRGK